MSAEFADAFSDDEGHPGPERQGLSAPEPELVYNNAVEFFGELMAQSYVPVKSALPHVIPEAGIFDA